MKDLAVDDELYVECDGGGGLMVKFGRRVGSATGAMGRDCGGAGRDGVGNLKSGEQGDDLDVGEWRRRREEMGGAAGIESGLGCCRGLVDVVEAKTADLRLLMVL